MHDGSRPHEGSAQPWIGVSMRSDPDGRLLGCLQHLRAAGQRVAVSVFESDVEAVLRNVGTIGPAHRDRTWAGDAEGPATRFTWSRVSSASTSQHMHNSPGGLAASPSTVSTTTRPLGARSMRALPLAVLPSADAKRTVCTPCCAGGGLLNWLRNPSRLRRGRRRRPAWCPPCQPPRRRARLFSSSALLTQRLEYPTLQAGGRPDRWRGLAQQSREVLQLLHFAGAGLAKGARIASGSWPGPGRGRSPPAPGGVPGMPPSGTNTSSRTRLNDRSA